jgi:hypothetical protein
VLHPKTNGQPKYKYLVTGRDKSYFVNNHFDSTRKFSETNIIKMLEFLIYIIFVKFYSVFFNKQSAFLWVPAVFFSLTFFFFHTGHLMKYEKIYPDSIISSSPIYMMSFN